MNTGFIEIKPKYFLNENWEILEPIPPTPVLKTLSDEEKWRNWIESTQIKVADVAETTLISSGDKYDYYKSELGMNIILPKGSIEKMRFKITLKGDGEISDNVMAIDGFPKDIIKEKEIISGKIKVGITKAFKFLPVVGNLLQEFLEIEFNPWEFALGSLKKVNVDFNGGLTFQPEWYFKEDGIKNDLRVALTIKKSKNIKNIEGEVQAAWIYNPGLLRKAIVGTDGKAIKIH